MSAAAAGGGATRAEVLERAAGLLRAGALERARALFQALLARHPRDADAVSGIGVVHLKTGAVEAALDCFGAAVAIDGGRAADYGNLAAAHRMAGRTEEAELCLRRAVDLAPDEPAARAQLAHLLDTGGRPEEAADVVAESLAHLPDSARLWSAAAAAARRAGRPGRALRALGHAICLAPGDHETWNDLGTTLGLLGHHAAAVRCLRTAAAFAPREPTVAANLAQHLLLLGRPGEAARLARTVTVLQPRLAAGHALLGRALAEAGDDAAATESLARALRLEPRAIDAADALAGVLRRQGRLGAALRTVDWALGVAPGALPLHETRATLLELLDRAAEAEAERERSYADCRQPRLLRDVAPAALVGRRILVIAATDDRRTVRLARFLPLLAARGATVALAGAPSLAPLGAGLGVTDWPSLDAPDPEAFDAVTPIERLPHLMQAAGTGMPEPPYLAPPAEAAGMRARLGDGPLMLWGAGADCEHDGASRDRLAAALRPFRLLCLPGTAPPGAAARAVAVPTVAALGALVAAVDRVVAGDSLTLHLVGALGRTAAAVLDRDHAGFWTATRPAGPWYPTVAALRPRAGRRRPDAGALADWLAATA